MATAMDADFTHRIRAVFMAGIRFIIKQTGYIAN
jgi:hypothetical protein